VVGGVRVGVVQNAEGEVRQCRGMVEWGDDPMLKETCPFEAGMRF